MLYCCNQNKSGLCVVYLFIPDTDKIKSVVYIYFDAEIYLYYHVRYHVIFLLSSAQRNVLYSLGSDITSSSGYKQ